MVDRLETLGVGVAGYRTKRFPGFFITDGGHEVDWQLDSPQQCLRVCDGRRPGVRGGDGALER